MNTPHSEFVYNQGNSFWKKRNYRKALECFLSVLELPHRKNWFYQIALLTGGAYKIKKLFFGKYPLLSSNGKKIIFAIKDNNFWKVFASDYYGNNKQQLFRVLSYDYIRPQLSLDGRYLGFIVKLQKESKVFLFNLNEKKLKLMLKLKGNISSFVFSPDSKYLALDLLTPNKASIELINLKKLEVLRGKVKEQRVFGPIFSPDSSKLVFLSKMSNAKNEVFIIIDNLFSNSRIVQKINKRIFMPLSCSPNSKYLIFGSVGGFFLLSLDLTTKKRLSFCKRKGKCRSFNFSNDCKNVLFISEVDDKYSINILNLKNLKIKSIFESRIPLHWCSFLPNAKKILCAQRQGRFIDKLFLIDLSNDKFYPIDTDIPCGFSNIGGQSNVLFHPDNKNIIFANSRDGDNRKPDQICQMDIQSPQIINNGHLVTRLKKLLTQEKVILKRSELTFRAVNPYIKNMIENISQKRLRNHVRKLEDLGPRISGSYSCRKTANFIYNIFAKYGLDVEYDSYDHPQNKKFNSQNVIATIRGGINPENVYIISAHYDSYAGSPGAWDDASGIAVVLEMARIMRFFQPNATIKFICFSGEELGNIGSRHFTQKAKKQNLHIRGFIDNDCIGYQTGDKMAVTLFYSSTLLSRVMYSASMLYSDLLAYGSTSKEYCGVLPFIHEFGNVTVSIQDYPYLPSPYMHHPKDRINSLSFALIAEVAKLNIAALTAISLCPVPVKGIKMEGQRNNRELYVSWEKNTEKDIKGYRIYYGKYPNIFDALIDVGNKNFCKIANLAKEKPHIISIRAYNRDGYESWGADELSIHNYKYEN